MYINVFPKTLLGLMHQIFPHRRFQVAMHPLVSRAEYHRRSLEIPTNRHILCAKELDRISAFPIEKRQNEWLTGRICAKLAVLQYYNFLGNISDLLEPAQFYITNDNTGRPLLAGRTPHELENADISISHGAGYGFAMIADGWCGADIQEPRKSLKNIREKFCTAEEEELLYQNIAELTELQRLTLIWTAKEALKKALSHSRMPGFLELILNSIEPHTNGWMARFLISSREYSNYPTTVDVATEFYQGYGIALCLSEEKKNA